MAENFHPVGQLAEYSLNLLRGQMINQLTAGPSLLGAGGLSLTEFILGKPKETARRGPGASQTDDALDVLLRSDSAMLRQASRNMLLAKGLLVAGGEAIGKILRRVWRMGEIVRELRGSAQSDGDLVAEYLELAAQIKTIIKNAQYDGVRLLDGSDWADDERVSAAEGTGKFSLQAGGAGPELVLYDLQSYRNTFRASDLGPETLALTGESLGEFAAALEGMAASYRARAGLLDAEAASLERRADVLDEAAGLARPGDSAGLRQALLDILLRDGGTVLRGVS